MLSPDFANALKSAYPNESWTDLGLTHLLEVARRRVFEQWPPNADRDPCFTLQYGRSFYTYRWSWLFASSTTMTVGDGERDTPEDAVAYWLLRFRP